MTPIEGLLREASERIAWPRGVDIAPAVLGRLDRGADSSRRPALAWVGLAALAVVLILAIPPAREAIADFLGVAGIHIELGTSEPGNAGFDLLLGEEMTKEQAESESGLVINAPADLPPPEAIYVSNSPVDGELTMVWPPSPATPEIADSGVGLLITQFRATGVGNYLKRATPETRVIVVSVSGVDGYWMEGAPHVLVFEDSDGVARQELSRLAGNVLIWEANGVTHRVESSLDLRSALAIAESMATD